MSLPIESSRVDARYRAIFEQASGGIIFAGLDGRFQLVNKRWCEMLGYTEEEMLGQSIVDLSFPEDHPQTLQNLERLKQGDPAIAIEKRYRHKDGHPVWMAVSVSPVLDCEGRTEAIMAFTVDIQERKEAENRRAFLTELSERLLPLTDPDDIIRVTVTAVGQHLRAHRCCFVEAKASEDTLLFSENWIRDSAEPLRGPMPLFAFGDASWWDACLRGDLAIADVAEHPLTAAMTESYAAIGVRSYAVQPYQRGDWTPILGVTDTVPRRWTTADLALLRNVVERVWPQVERARAEQALMHLREESDRRARLYEAIMSFTPDFVYTIDLDGRFSYANRALLEMWGKRWDEAVGKTFTEIGYPDWHAEMHNREVEQVKLSRQPYRGEVPFVGTHGRRIYDYIFAPVFNASGEVESIAGTTRDVTDRHDAEAELRQQTARRQLLGEATAVLLTSDDPSRMIEELFARLAQQLPVDSCFSFSVDDNGDTLVLQSCLGVTEAQADTIARVPFGDAISGLVAQRREPVVEVGILQSTSQRLKRSRDMGIRTYACFPLIADGRLLGTLGFGSSTRDSFADDEIELLGTVSRYVTVAYERLRLISELRKADRKKDDFIALLAHELRNPLAPLRNGLQVLRLADNDSNARRTARDMMDRQLSHMVRLIEDLLDVSRISLNKLTLRRERLLLSDVMMHAVESARPAVEAAGHELVVTLPATPIPLDADLTRLAQVFSNLLSNSAKYTEPGGRITITATEHAGTAVVEVRDNGIGMPPEALTGIFDMFSQINRTMERTAGGLGIGLALVKGLVHLHGGTVSAASDGPELGSTFTVSLPIAGADVVGVVPADHRDGGVRQRPRKRILVVDDNRDAAESMRAMLEMLGNDVHTAHDGVEAIEAAQRIGPHLVLMDIGMPRLNGYEATRRIREQLDGQRMMIVALTGWGQDSDRRESRGAGCDRHLVKPVSPVELELLLDELA